MPRSLERDRAEHSDSATREKKIDRALNGQAPADESDDERDAVPDIVKGDDEGAEREVNECVKHAADFTFLAEEDEKAQPHAGLDDVRHASHEEDEGGHLFDGCLIDHAKNRSGERSG